MSGQLQGPLSTPGISFPIGYPFPDELSQFSFEITEEAGHCQDAPTRPCWPIMLLQLSSILHTQKTTAATGAPSLEFFVCVLPSLISGHTHLSTCDRQPLPLGPSPVSTPALAPPIFCSPETSVCCEANEQESWGNFRVDCWNRTSGPPRQSYIIGVIVGNLAVCSLEHHHSIFCRRMLYSHTVNGHITLCIICFCSVWNAGSIILFRYLIDSYST